MDTPPDWEQIDEALYWKTHEVAESVYLFLRGFYLSYFAFITYRTLLKDDEVSCNYFWFRLNEKWLFMNHEPEEMFILGLI
ncbi:MAG: hypothetical protein QNJ37_18095 [Crocosphaera sp.]|nr:hypothetical protein [Crocosphaera sp.]